MNARAARKPTETAFPIPEAALQQHIASLGKTGSGKTSTCKLIIEHVVAEGHRVCVLDPIKSDWWGITSSADGKQPGLPFTILGGPRAHAPLPPKAGKVLGELVATGKLPLSILDMADFGMGQHQAFFTAFAEALFRKIEGVLYLVVEEAHEFAPKEQAGIKGENLAVYWFKKLATGSRSKGIRLLVATQRTQALHNAVLGSCDTAIVHRTTLPADQKPVRDWLKGNIEDKAVVAQIDTGMSSIPTGSGWLCCSEQKVFEFVAWPRIATFDNSATPTKGAASPRAVKTAAVDLDALKALIGDAVAEVAANDPAHLKAELAKVRRELAAAQKHPAAAPISDADRKRLHDEGFNEALRMIADEREAERAEAFAQGADAMLKQLQDAAGAARAKLAPPKPAPKALAPPRAAKPAPAAPAAPVRHVAPARPKPAAPVAADTTGIGSGHMRILEAMAFWESLGIAEPTRDQVAGAAGFAPGGTFRAYVGKLNTHGLIENAGVGALRLTDAGRDVAPAADTSISARERLGKIIGSGHARILDAIPRDGSPISRADLADAAGFDQGGTFRAYLGKLNTLGAVRNAGVGAVQVEPWVWLE